MPARQGDDPLREPTRPRRDQRPPDRLAYDHNYSLAAVGAKYAEALQVGFDLTSHRFDHTALTVGITEGADRLIDKALALGGIEHDISTYMASLRAEYEGLDEEA